MLYMYLVRNLSQAVVQFCGGWWFPSLHSKWCSSWYGLPTVTSCHSVCWFDGSVTLPTVWGTPLTPSLTSLMPFLNFY